MEKALASTGDPWMTYVQWLRDIVAADTHALTVHLAGQFTRMSATRLGPSR